MRTLITIVIAALSLNAFGQVPNYVPSDGLVAWHPFNGNANDGSPNGHNGVVNGALLVPDRNGNQSSAYGFDGLNDNITVDILFDEPERSFFAWFRSAGSTGTNQIVFLNDHQQLNHGHSAIAFHDQTLVLQSGTMPCGNQALAYNTWYHAGAVRSSESTMYYFNGDLLCTVPNDNIYSSLGTFIKLILGSTHVDRFFFGEIDDVGIWNRALSASEVTSLFNTPSPIQGCTDETACNFDQDATVDDGSCIPSGCMDTYACNFNSEAECEGEACDYSCCPGPGCCNDGTYWDVVTQTCIVTNPTDTNFDGCTDLNDLLDILSAYGGCAEVNYSLSFDGVDDYVEVNNQEYGPTTSTNFSVSCWFKTSTGGTIISKYDNLNAANSNFFISYNSEDGNFQIAGNGTNSMNFVYIQPTNIWTHVSIVFMSSGEVNAYVNGDLASSGNVNLNSSIASIPIGFGKVFGPDPGFFEGELDDVHIWNTALTQEQIQSYMSNPPTGNEEGLVGYWDFNEGTGSTLTDQTSNGNDGVINGATWSTDVPTAP
jgi:hypothetical protein